MERLFSTKKDMFFSSNSHKFPYPEGMPPVKSPVDVVLA
jgi:hypothetical protein